MSSSGRQKIDYSGRTVDLLLLKTVLKVPSVNQRVDLDISNVSGEPMIVTGIEKLAQRYIISFLNALGSTKFVSDHGTNIIPKTSKGAIYNQSTLEAAASEANVIAAGQITDADEGLETPDDETLVKSEITDLEFLRNESLIRISVKLTTGAGNSYIYIIPVGEGVH